ncbi:hypothetical protein BHE74_00027882 [Ensete ventricosum]|nr:hypothetical protein BHE74_00027882 [Ensete ventricosum]
MEALLLLCLPPSGISPVPTPPLWELIENIATPSRGKPALQHKRCSLLLLSYCPSLLSLLPSIATVLLLQPSPLITPAFSPTLGLPVGTKPQEVCGILHRVHSAASLSILSPPPPTTSAVPSLPLMPPALPSPSAAASPLPSMTDPQHPPHPPAASPLPSMTDPQHPPHPPAIVAPNPFVCSGVASESAILVWRTTSSSTSSLVTSPFTTEGSASAYHESTLKC